MSELVYRHNIDFFLRKQLDTNDSHNKGTILKLRF